MSGDRTGRLSVLGKRFGSRFWAVWLLGHIRFSYPLDLGSFIVTGSASFANAFRPRAESSALLPRNASQHAEFPLFFALFRMCSHGLANKVRIA